MMTFFSLLLLAVSTVAWTEKPTLTQDCREWQECRQLALDAAKREDYNAFHDLAWRTMSLGPKNDPSLMLLLARAQSLSGRPHDALVMLQRLASMGVATDAATSNDFERVRALPAWAEFEAKVSGKPAPTRTAETKPPSAPSDPAPTVKPESTAGDVRKPEPPKNETAAAAEPARVDARTARTPGRLIFAASGLTAVGLAYDAVSGRFIVADKNDRRLLVVGERSGHMASLAGVDAGFDDVSAFEIDATEGDLWVVSASSRSRSSTVHKLQLISGRVLASIPLSPDEGPARFTDVAVTPQSILALDGEGRRVYRVAKKGRTLELVARLAAPECTSLAPAADGVAYAAYDRGILRLDLTTRATTVVEPASNMTDPAPWWASGGFAGTGDRSLRFRAPRRGRFAWSA